MYVLRSPDSSAFSSNHHRIDHCDGHVPNYILGSSISVDVNRHICRNSFGDDIRSSAWKKTQRSTMTSMKVV